MVSLEISLLTFKAYFSETLVTVGERTVSDWSCEE